MRSPRDEVNDTCTRLASELKSKYRIVDLVRVKVHASASYLRRNRLIVTLPRARTCILYS